MQRTLALALASLSALLAPIVQALEPTAQAVEFYNATLNHYFVTAFPEEAAALDKGVPVAGWTRTGVAWNVWKDAARRHDRSARCAASSARRTRDRTRTSTPRMRPSARRSGRTRTGPTRRSPSTSKCRRAAPAPRAASPSIAASIPAPKVSESNHRFLPDLTMHQKMAASSTLEGVVMCSPLSTAQKQADVVRLLEQATFGPTDALVAHVDRRRHPGVPRRAVRRDRVALFEQQVRSVRAGGDLLPDRSRSDVRARLLLAVPAAERLLSATRSRATTSCASASRSRCRRSSSRRASTSTRRTGWRRYQQIFLDDAFGNYEDLMTRVTLSSVMGDYLNMVNNDKPVAGRQSQRELRARAAAALHDRPVGAATRTARR